MFRPYVFQVCLPLLGLAACGEVGGSVSDAPASDASPDSAPTFHVAGTVTGFAGRGMVLQLGDEDLAISADGAFMFPTPLLAGSAFTVTLKTAPTCPERTCAVANGTGTIGAADVTDVTVSCAVPSYRLASQSWGSNDARVTDDLGALANNATATPRIISGASTGVNGVQHDGIAIDSTRALAYIGGASTTPANVGISVFATSANGSTAPARRIVIANETSVWGLELDPVADRLYVSVASEKVLVFDAASTLDGTVTPTATIPLAAAGALSLDRFADRLYVGKRGAGFYVFDGARLLTAASVPNRTVTWAVGDTVQAVAIDGCRDRLYLGFRQGVAGHNIYAFDGAAALAGAIDLETAQARASVPSNQVMAAVLDTQGALYFWPDSPLKVHVVNAPEAWSGAVAVTPDRSIDGVVNRGYSLDVQAY